VPRLISDELFQAASLRAIKNKKSRRTIQAGQVDYLLTGKLFCGHCGESMGGSWGTSKSGTRHYYYVCNGKKTKKSACHKKAERKEDLEKLVVDVVIKNVLCNQAVVDFIIDRCMQIQEQDTDTSAAEGLRRELADAEKRLENLMTAIESGIITTTTKARLVELEERCATLKQGIAEAEIRPPKFSREQLEFIFEKYQNRDMDDLSFIRDVIDTFVHAVYVYDNKLLITFNYSGDNTVEIPLSEIEKSVDSAGSQVFDFYGINSTIPKKLITGIIHCNQLFYFPILIILRPHRASP
jgi:site-specific DNA recombinase